MKTGDTVKITDPLSPHFARVGKVASTDDGKVQVEIKVHSDGPMQSGAIVVEWIDKGKLEQLQA